MSGVPRETPAPPPAMKATLILETEATPLLGEERKSAMRRIPSIRDLIGELNSHPVMSEEQLRYQKEFPNVEQYIDKQGVSRVRLPIGKKVAFALPGFSMRVIECFRSSALKKYYVDIALLPLWWIGFMEVGAVGLDAISQPVIASMGDRTRSKYGRRRPFFVVGCAMVACMFTLLWMPCYFFSCELMEGTCQNHAVGGKGIFTAVVYALFYLALDFSNGPYEALGPELTPDYDDRTSLYSWQAMGNVFGRGFGVILPGLFLLFWPKTQGFLLLAGCSGIAYVACCWTTACAVQEKVRG